MRSQPHVGPRVWTVPVALVALGAVAPAMLHATLAGAAAILFEATPFVLLSALLERAISRRGRSSSEVGCRPGTPRWVALAVAAAGCGCSGRLGGTLSLPAFGLCWLTFGPLAACARLGAGLALAAAMSRKLAAACESAPDPLEELHRLLPSAVAGALLSAWLVGGPAIGLSPVLALLFGALSGLLTPCSTGAVALAAAVRTAQPLAAVGLLVASTLPRFGATSTLPRGPLGCRVAYGALAVASAWLVTRSGAGFVHPRLVPLVALGAALALACALPASGTRFAGRSVAAPALLLVALVFGSPAPSSVANETTLEGAFPGERVAFEGFAQRRAGATVLVRYAITCCRADAAPVALRLDRTLPVAAGSWISARGTLRRAALGLVLHPDAVESMPPPADPFVYR
ncbi:MAG: hypothetical protein ABI346_02160 [Candidatus Baltobacteraceae bacterium]